MIQSVGVAKAYSARQGGDVAGAIVNIESKQLDTDNLFEVKEGRGVNTSVIGNQFLKQDGTNYWGKSNRYYPSNDVFGGMGIIEGVGNPFDNELDPSSKLYKPVDH